MILQNKHIVLKTKDVDSALSTTQIEQLKNICITITNYRKDIGKKEVTGVFVDSGWVGYNDVLESMRKHHV